ncbi:MULTISPECIES: Ig-like domain-containing protein [unclassified Clostridium]|uniref:Ig-like domain-containing protein n=1 Tax=unclassified Clostridium TaxID=2614128 RepID=UPI00029772C2|nr:MULTISPECIES: Ig-like domain-containing protein [unclassified Clostridium]EKQ50507.1 MAG: putative cell wall binding protein [Clostridium sp. Maddingley MBC34-26]
MKREFICKIIAGAVILSTICSLAPVRASAEWVNDYQGNWYYTQNDEKVTGWKKIDGQLYYFDDNGKMLKGWIKAGDSWYFIQSNGTLKTGWINYNKNWYYSDSTGAIQTGIINVAGKVYIFDDNGIMKTTNTVINGEFYTIASDGEVAGVKVPTPDREFDNSGNCVQVLKNTDNKVTGTPTDSKTNEVIKDQSTSDENPNEGRIFKVVLKDSNGAELKTKNVKYGKTVDLYEPSKIKYNFSSWNTKSDGSGKSYAADDSIKVEGDITLYAQWTNDTSVFVDGITIKGSAYVTVNKTAQMTAEVLPSDAENKGVTWSVVNGTGKATIDSNGLLTGVSTGTVTVKATANDGSDISTTKEVTVSATDVVVPVTKITVNSQTGSYLITANAGTLQMLPNVLPSDANNPDVTWTIENGTGSASISDTGLVTAISNGTVSVVATAKDGSGVIGKRTVTITGQSTKIPVEGIAVSGKTSNTIAIDGGTLQMVATVYPSSATNKSVTWAVGDSSDTGRAVISDTGLLTALSDGIVTVKAISAENNTIIGSGQITIKGQTTKVEKIGVTSASDLINVDGQTMQMSAQVSPSNAVDQSIVWSVEQYGDAGTKMTGKASISSTGLLTPLADGTVTVKATSKKVPTIYGSKTITISNQSIKATGLIITPDDVKELDTKQGTSPELQFGVIITPNNATNTTSGAVKWEVRDVNGDAEFVPGQTGLLRALKNGTVIVTATTIDGSNISVSKALTISGLITDVTDATIVGKDTSSSGSTDDLSTITQKAGTLQMALVLNPIDAASNGTVTWSVVQAGDADADNTITGKATISATGLLKAVDNGTVKVKAHLTYNMVKLNSDGSVMRDANGNAVIETKVVDREKIITISGQPVYVSGIDISSPSGTVTVGQQLQMTAIITPTGATNKTIQWSVESIDGGNASIGSGGLLQGTVAGNIYVRATATDGSGTTKTIPITVVAPTP